ncbi:TonB-dependent receptor domain-containing protein [uncultured Sphingomonas sp.]|uniref:TonB-dependent receptor domain-containing protein n=1 Tax=uncultured Sphingomonas sp. TaxID=158754 RepID=UPI0035CAA466
MLRHLAPSLLAGAALLWPLAAAATDLPRDAVSATSAAEPEPTAEPDPDQSDIIVTGRGQTRQVQELRAADIAILTPGTSPLKAIEKLPSVNFQSADAFGAYEWAQRVSIRGFNQNQIGFTLDGIPLGDGSYGNTNGLHISRAISSENIGRTVVSQGAGAIGSQATNNLGGTIEFFSSDPAPVFGLTLNGTYGSQNTVRAFGRLDTGVLGDNGPSAYVSYGYLDTEKWKGFGSQRQNQVNAKFIAPLGYDVQLVGTFDFSDRRENDYQDMSLGMIGRLGYRWDNISNDFPLAVRVADVGANTGYTGAPRLNPAAGTTYPAPFANADDAYYDAAGLRTDYLASIGVETEAGAPVRAMLKGYYHDNRGQGIWYTPYVPSPSGVPISIRTTEYGIHRKGAFGAVGGSLGAFGDLTVGGWYEDNDFRQARRFYGLDSRTVRTREPLEFQRNAFATQWDFNYTTETVQYHVEDRIPIGALTVNLGWKGYDVRNTADPITRGSLAAGKIKVTDWFQPHAGATYAVNDDAELFAGFTQVTRAFASSATSGPFATTQAGFDALLNGATELKPEESDTYELGARIKGRGFNASLAGYYVDFRNRLLGVTTSAGIVGNPAILQNVGGVRSYGAEATAEWKVGGGFGVFASYSYNDSTYRDNVVTATGTVPIKDKTVVDSPRHLAKGELTYDDTRFFARAGANYMSKRFFTYTNDQSVPGRVLVDATIGARVTLGERKVELQLNAVNLLDKDYVATIGSNGFGNSGDNQTLLIGAPRQVFATLKTAF